VVSEWSMVVELAFWPRSDSALCATISASHRIHFQTETSHNGPAQAREPQLATARVPLHHHKNRSTRPSAWIRACINQEVCSRLDLSHTTHILISFADDVRSKQSYTTAVPASNPLSVATTIAETHTGVLPQTQRPTRRPECISFNASSHQGE
jgi:hypothetical protein